METYIMTSETMEAIPLVAAHTAHEEVKAG